MERETKIISVGCSAKVILTRGETSLLKIVSETENAAPERGIISVSSPMGNALLGKGVGDRATFKVGSKDISINILEIIR